MSNKIAPSMPQSRFLLFLSFSYAYQESTQMVAHTFYPKHLSKMTHQHMDHHLYTNEKDQKKKAKT